MILSDFFQKKNILLNFEAENKNEVILKLCKFVAKIKNLEVEPLYDVVMERERLGSTAVGNRVAIPHGRTALLNDIVFVLGRTISEIDFDSYDNEKCKLFVLILTPLNFPKNQLKVLARLGRFFQDKDNALALLQADTVEKVFNIMLRLNKEK